MKLKKLLQEVPVDVYRGSKEIEITGLCCHSKRVAPGNLFIAKKGHTVDAATFIDEAIATGAAAVLSDMGNPFLKEVTQLVHPDVCAVEGRLAGAFYGYPSNEMLTIGITGTCGKTSTTAFIKHLFDALGLLCGMTNSIEYCLGEVRYPAELAMPEVITLNKFLREMVQQGCRAAAIEVNSHGLVQGRSADIKFDCALFTNFSHDHLDYHHTMEEYADAKGILFASLAPEKVAVVTADSPWTERVLRNCSARVFRFGESPQADVRVENITLSPSGSTFDVIYREERLPFETTLLGRHNVFNTLAAIAVMLSQGVPLADLPPHVRTLPSVAGRLERVGMSRVFVDFAHKPDALEKVLATLKEFAPGRIISVFGCGGERDKEKRPLMASISEKYADFTVVTSDNPRSEDPVAICQEVAAGFTNQHHLIEPDRKAAIARAIQLAHPDDLILIAGKGHEKVQLFAHTTIPFDDYRVVETLLQS